MNIFNEYTVYFRDILLLNITFFAAVFGRREKVRDSQIRIKLLLALKKGRLYNFIDKFIFPKGIKQTRILYGIFLLNFVYTIAHFFLYNNNFSCKIILILFLVSSCLSSFLVYLIALKHDTERFTQKIIEEKYIEFSNDIDDKEELFIIAGDLSFFGEIPKISDHDRRNREKCHRSFEKCECENSINNNKCSNNRDCVFMHAQFRQLIKLNEKDIILRLLVRKPRNTEQDKHAAVLGKLICNFKDKIDIRFYKDEMISKNKLLARIKTKVGKPIMFWNWKNLDMTYSNPEELKEESPMGSTFIYLFNSLLWNETVKITNEEMENYKNIYKQAICIS